MAKTKALISFFVFAYADCWFSHEAAHMSELIARSAAREVYIIEMQSSRSIMKFISPKIKT